MRIPQLPCIFSGVLCASALLAAVPIEPDALLLKDGSEVTGLIVKNSRDEVVLQTAGGEKAYPKSGILRIRDEPDDAMIFTEQTRPGRLPPWRVIANDLRSNDAVESLVQIPATTVDVGVFRNVPYLSFRANRWVEINVYGSPDDPAGLEIGAYGPAARNHRLRGILRAYMAGFLGSREEVGALYDLDLNDRDGGRKKVGRLTIEITPPEGQDAYGAWWISLYDEDRLAKLRVDDAAYAKLTIPSENVLDRRGGVRVDVLTTALGSLGQTGSAALDAGQSMALGMGDLVEGFARGFVRDSNKVLRFLTAGLVSGGKPPETTAP